jgi:two-component system OmpR family sensor kinase
MTTLFRRFRRSIRTQLIVNNVLSLALLLCVLGGIIRYTVWSTMMASVDRELDAPFRRFDAAGPHGPWHGDRDHADHGRDARDHPQPPVHAERPPDTTRRDVNPYRPRLFDSAGKPVPFFGDGLPLWDSEGVLRAEREGSPAVFATVSADGVPLRVMTRPLRWRGSDVRYVQAAYPLTDVFRALAGLNRALLLLSPLALLFAGIGGALLTDRMLRRVGQLSHAAGRMGGDDLSERLPVSGDDEFSQLAATFNGLLARVEAAFREQARVIELQRQFTADASHELKTPLTTIKGTASMALSAPPSEALFRQSLRDIDRAAGTMSHLVKDLLLLARSDSGQAGGEQIEILLREVLERALPPASPDAPAVTLRVADESLTVRGGETSLVRLFRNLLDNAVRCTPATGSVTVTSRRVGSMAVIDIADTGVGIAPEHLPHLGERFYRVDESRSRPDGGTGLGISISRTIAESYGGGLRFESQLGVGTTAYVTLPAAA